MRTYVHTWISVFGSQEHPMHKLASQHLHRPCNKRGMRSCSAVADMAFQQLINAVLASPKPIPPPRIHRRGSNASYASAEDSVRFCEKCPAALVPFTVSPDFAGVQCNDRIPGGDPTPLAAAAATATVPPDAAHCGAGIYCPSGSAGARIPCPFGSYCPRASVGPTPCAGGEYCPAGSSEPTRCPCGYKCPVGAPGLLQCAAGYYCPEGAASMTQCPPGHFCPEPATCTPTPCPPGTFQPRPMAKLCRTCPVGEFGPDHGLSACLPCSTAKAEGATDCVGTA